MKQKYIYVRKNESARRHLKPKQESRTKVQQTLSFGMICAPFGPKPQQGVEVEATVRGVMVPANVDNSIQCVHT